MSYTFSRRDFMKYTALTAVAIAGSGMLTGCSNPNRPVGTIGSTLKPGDGICEATLKSATYNRTTLTCEFEIYTKVSLQVNQQHFQVNVTDADNKLHTYYQGVSGVTIDLVGGSNASVDAKTTVTPTLKVSGIENLTSASKVQVLYIPKMYASRLRLWTDFTFALKARTLWCGSFCVCGPFVSKFWAISCKMRKVF